MLLKRGMWIGEWGMGNGKLKTWSKKWFQLSFSLWSYTVLNLREFLWRTLDELPRHLLLNLRCKKVWFQALRKDWQKSQFTACKLVTSSLKMLPQTTGRGPHFKDLESVTVFSQNGPTSRPITNGSKIKKHGRRTSLIIISFYLRQKIKRRYQ